jgi:hypothetical protein
MTLVERLRAVESSSEWGNAPGAPTTCWYRNPDGPEAADALEAAEKALEQCRKRFTEYASEHQRKAGALGVHPVEQDARMAKADRNLDMAMVCNAALSKLRGTE